MGLFEGYRFQIEGLIPIQASTEQNQVFDLVQLAVSATSQLFQGNANRASAVMQHDLYRGIHAPVRISLEANFKRQRSLGIGVGS